MRDTNLPHANEMTVTTSFVICKRDYEDYQQLPEEAVTACAERITLHSAGRGVLKRAHMACLHVSAVL